MKTLIIALNSKYIHSSIAPWYLKASCGAECGDVHVLERTINENADDVLAAIYSYKADVMAFSCYIWNITMALGLASDLKKLLPRSVIVLGGPEVSYDAEELLKVHEFVDYIVAGEGEKAFPRLLACLAGGKTAGETTGCSPDELSGTRADELAVIEGLAFRSGPSGIFSNPPALVLDLDSIPSPYTAEMLSALQNRIAYFEASRGCPFSCSYCLSSVSEGVRYFSMERIVSDLERLVASGVTQVKFVDRTFNANREKARLIMRHILERYGSGSCNFHFEVGADLFDEETMSILENAPKGLFQIEAGVQSTNEKALAAVCRKTDTAKLLENIRRLRAGGNVHIHADLIAGLPHEDYGSFAHSFDSVYRAGPHQLQLGFLKFLKGTRLRREADETEGMDTANGYKYRKAPPYEILSGGCLDFEELGRLKGIASLVDKYYNSGRFACSLDYLTSKAFETPFAFYECFLEYCNERGLLYKPVALRDYYALLYGFASERLDESGRGMLLELLRLDFLASDNTGTLPAFFESRGDGAFRDRCFDFLRDSRNIEALIPEASGMSPKQVIRKVHFERFNLRTYGHGIRQNERRACIGNESVFVAGSSFDPAADTVILFNYFSRDRVTGRYRFFIADIGL